MGYRSQGALEQFGRTEAMKHAQRRTVERVGKMLHEKVEHHTPVAKPPPGHEAEWLRARKRAPGTLKGSWRMGSIEIDSAGEIERIPVYTMDRVAPHVEWPTRPHLIAPKRPGGMLRFWTKTGATVYALIVHHPGTQGSYMMTTSIAEVANEWQHIGREELDTWARDQMALVG